MKMNGKDIHVEHEKGMIDVWIDKPRGQVSLTGNDVFLRFTKDQADRLAFQINSCIQDMERGIK